MARSTSSITDCGWNEISAPFNNAAFSLSLISGSRLKILVMLSIKKPTPVQSAMISKARQKLQRELVTWRQSQFNLCPLLKPCIDAVDPTSPEQEKLMLPSSFDQVLRGHLGLTSLAVVERQLREGQAYDALDDLCEKIKIFNTNLDFKKKNVFGQGANTRAQNFLKQLAADKVNAADKYRTAYRALISLGLSASDPSLQELRDDQLFGKDASRPAKLGDSKREDPWFWTVARPSNLPAKEQAEWSLERKACSYLKWILYFPPLQWTVSNTFVIDPHVIVPEKKRKSWKMRWHVLPDLSLSRKRLGMRLEQGSMKIVPLHVLHMLTNRPTYMHVSQVIAKLLKKRLRKRKRSISNGTI